MTNSLENRRHLVIGLSAFVTTSCLGVKARSPRPESRSSNHSPGHSTAQSVDYHPLQLSPTATVQQLDLTVASNHQGQSPPTETRTIPLRVYLPKAPGAVVLFSHGLGGNREGSVYLGEHWAKRGYVAVFLQHPGSDDTVWKTVPVLQRRAALKRAASLQNFLLRVEDVSAVLNQLEIWNRTPGHPLFHHLNLAQIGMSGHSFGALTTQAVSGESFSIANYTDPRIRAAVIMSPSSPQRMDPALAFGSVKIPWLLMTGTHDLAPIGPADLHSRLNVFPNLPPGDKYELVLDQAEHSVFTDRALPGDRLPRNPQHHQTILALSTAFWDAYLLKQPQAKLWLQGDGVRTQLQPQDHWQLK